MTNKKIQILELLASKFERDTSFSSSIRAEHPYFQTIVAWGKLDKPTIVPWLLNHLDDNWHWAIALQEIAGENSPAIPDKYAGCGREIARLWLEWGRLNNYI